ncbi:MULTISPECIES: triose-phosphate isomerase [unclassified Aureimonas]|uniref:triose-phosphate isomerase n=1 Tax=unclassified Aureimonas TaxID=2615206 RepID=UPI0006F35680|nr:MULTISPECIES: triose-phosphate isomerase [unclassified Aureimonas]KQT60329.1 triosephosphate isomerase [Aureimonas sp. Leaf427]KQT79205.1 triosephosphate isomerase [Aureimonas sp. Leaf460]
MARQPLIAGNWKMNGSLAALAELEAMVEAAEAGLGARLLICPPATLLSGAAEIANGVVAIGGQDCHTGTSGAHTGDVSAEMLKDIGASHVILGHSERRADHGETDALVRAKTEAAWKAGLVAVVCIGETQGQRDAGETLDVLGTQLAGSLPDGVSEATTVVAYEPVWAIGTGRTPTAGDVAEVHAFLRKTIVERFGEAVGQGVALLYGGSVKPSNAAELLGVANVDGALVGGASLKADDFIAICRAASPS